MCDCIKDTENELKEILKDNDKYKKLESFRVFYPNVALSPNEDNVWKLSYYLEFIAEGTYETKGGNVKTKKESLSVRFTYCPLCGEKISK